MSVDTKHKSYLEFAPIWKKMRDAVSGEEKVKDAGEDYLPKLSGPFHKYDPYKSRAYWYDATERTVQGCLGSIFRKDPKVEIAPDDKFDLERVTRDGRSFKDVAMEATLEILSVGRYGILVDMPTKAEQPDDKKRTSYFATYKTEDIINWREVAVGSSRLPVLIVLAEEAEEADPENPYNTLCVKKRRELILEGGKYIQRLWRLEESKSDDESDEWVPDGEDIIPLKNGRPLEHIPFYSITPFGCELKVRKPPLLGVANMNFSHYRTTADLEHLRHWSAIITPWATGVKPRTDLQVGGNGAWMIEDPNAKVGMLEPEGKALQELREALMEKERKMAALGARLLEDQKKEAEAADTLRIRQAGEQATLSGVARAISDGLERALKFAVGWLATKDPEATVELNTDFFGSQMSMDDAVKCMEMWQSGFWSYETAYHNISQGERTRPGVGWEEEFSKVQTEEQASMKE